MVMRIFGSVHRAAPTFTLFEALIRYLRGHWQWVERGVLGTPIAKGSRQWGLTGALRSLLASIGTSVASRYQRQPDPHSSSRLQSRA